MAKRKKHWMAKAFSKNKGKFSRKAHAKGMSTGEYAREEASAPGALGKEARLAETGAKISRRSSRHRHRGHRRGGRR